MSDKSRFGDYNLEQIRNEIKDLIPQNTIRSKKYIWKQFTEFCEKRNHLLEENTSNEKLADILTEWAFNMRKIDGSEYKEMVVKTMWNTTAKLLQEKYYNEYNRTLDPFKDIPFQVARNARNMKRKRLQSIPEKRKISSVSLTSEEMTNIVQSWDENNPNGLQRKVYHIIAVELAWRGGEACRCLVNFFKEEINNDGTPSGRLEYNPIFTKTAQGGARNIAESKWLVPNKDKPENCPVRLFKKLISKRGVNIKTDRLFLTVNNNWYKDNNSPWFKNMPIGINEISKWTKSAAEKIGLDTKKVKISNHSNRSTAVSQLASSGIGEQQIIKVTGHSSSTSIKPYLQLNKEHHAKIISNLRSEDVNISTTQTVVSTSTKKDELDMDNVKIYNSTNCTFNINIYNK